MNVQNIQLLFDYNYWANNRLLAAAAQISEAQFLAPSTFGLESLRDILTHVLGAEMAWRLRCEQVFDVPEPPLPATLQILIQQWRAEEAAMRRYLQSVKDADLDRGITYPIDEGKTRTRVLWHILVHVVNHGTQHRSEAAALLTSYGHSLGDTDFTVFLNSRS